MPYKNKRKQREAQVAYQRRRRARRHLVLQDLLGDSCCICGNSERALEADHIDPQKKKFTLMSGYGLGRSEDIWLKEAEKCQLLCNPCHRKKTSKENSKKIQHGTITAYKDRACRCVSCREIYSEYRRVRYQQTGW